MRTDTSIQPRSRRSPGVGARLLLAQALVLLAGGATTGVVAVIVGPPLFREHLNRAGLPHSSNEQFHAEEAYRYATAISVAVAIGVAALTALVVTWYFSRRLQRSIAEVASAATAVADGRYDIRVSPLRLGEDFGNLSRAFNRMSERLESVETTRRQLFGDLAHEIRTPVSVLKAYIEAVEDGVKTLDPETVAVLNDQASRLVRFSDDFAALAQAEEGPGAVTPQWIDPQAAIVTTVSAAVDRYAEKDVALTFDAANPLPEVWVDPLRLAQVIGNLLDNALRHTPARGRVEVDAAAKPGAVIITVRDNGDGIAAEHLPHVFERFYRADVARDRSHGGAGIGLAIAKALTEAHSGRITAASRGPGLGSTFTIELPARTDRRDD
ncbi:MULTISPECIES: sensor histidine kinase [Mycolicibacterium]|uniref:histidine kinase n=1 Tax=Mycolicibacterium hippocampi TaxID=659824 RepID=A0A7I9ZEZ1_9MYCO|nr:MULTISPECIES: HAMP domain-containing sensor histidine kinase [Mycolicibacterium]MCG7583421.1 ATP-binding protein [Mycolicibacterium sp. OfavD-34-C]MCK5752646.1 HAMP domain-containing histidine kinase [Mycobacterium sp.]GFG99591.1 putative sensor histidine kinase [Mycolicibacterium hippocampi]